MSFFTHMRGGWLGLWLVLLTGSAYAQQTVSGNVSSEAEGALPGVNVLVKGTTSGTVTDLDGNYNLSVPEGSDTLVFSSIGYANQEIAINDQSTIDVLMGEDIKALEEIVVVGYGTQEKKEITSAVASVDPEEFNRGNVNDVGQLLQGKVSGLTISRPGGNPNDNFTIRLRGLSTIGQNSGPLVVVDGVVGADLNSVDPNDIASMDILKDGSAAAIYGTRGSSGVILITTKTGEAGKATVDYNGYVTSESVAKTVEVMNAGEFRSLLDERGINNDQGSETDWFDEVSRNAISQVHNLALSGGVNQTTYRVSLNYRDIEGVALSTGFERINGRLNLSQKALDNRLTISTNLAITTQNSDLGFNEAFRYAAIYNPTAPVFDNSEDNIYGGYFQQDLFDYFNPVAILEQNTNQQELRRINLNIQAELEVIDGLRVLARYSQQRESELNEQYYDKNSFWPGSANNFVEERDGDNDSGFTANVNGLANRNNQERFNELFEATANYEASFDRLDASLLVGYSYQEFDNEGFGAIGGNFATNFFNTNSLGAAISFYQGLGDVFSTRDRSKLIAVFGRLNLNYDGTYFLSLSNRYEGSTKFGVDNKWGNFPAISAGVTLSNLIDVPAVNNLKLRASYGETGAIPRDSYLSQLVFEPSGNFFFFNGDYVLSYGPTRNANRNLRWERKREFDVGLDFSLLGERLSGTFDWYTRNTVDLIYQATVPVPPNFSDRTFVNVGELDNTGIELALNFVAVSKEDFSWTVGGNFATFDTELVSFTNDEGLGVADFTATANLGAPGQNNTQIARAIVGQELGIIWGREFDGVAEDGTWQFVDQNDDGLIDEADEVVIGNGLPDFEVGLSNSFTFGNFDLNFFFRGAFGHDLVNTYRAFYEVPSVAVSYNVVNTEFLNRDLDDSPLFNSIHVEDASFVKLDNATLGYNFPLGENTMVSNLRIYLSGQNLFYITNYTGVDPEVRFFDGSQQNPNLLAPGIDRRNTWARTRSFTLGVNVSF